MKQSGYIRKIDELGRIVIPKEVRKKLGIQDNENILISCEAENIIINKYSYLNNYNNFINYLANLTSEIFKIEISIFDRENLVFTNHNTEDLKIKYEDDVINNSISIGKVIIFTEKNDDNYQNKILKSWWFSKYLWGMENYCWSNKSRFFTLKSVPKSQIFILKNQSLSGMADFFAYVGKRIAMPINNVNYYSELF